MPPKYQNRLIILLAASTALLFITVITLIYINYFPKVIVPINKLTTPTPLPSSLTVAPSTYLESHEKYYNSIFGISFQYPKGFILTDELPKTKSPTGPKNSLTLTDAKKNTMSIVVDPAGFGPIFADKKVELSYSAIKGLHANKTTPATSQENLDPLITAVWYQFDSTTYPNLTIITSSQKTNKDFESTVTRILSTFKFL